MDSILNKRLKKIRAPATPKTTLEIHSYLDIVKQGIHKLYTIKLNPADKSLPLTIKFEELHRTVYQSCILKFQSEMYELIKQEFCYWINEFINSKFTKFDDVDCLEFIDSFILVYKENVETFKNVQQFSMYMERCYIKKEGLLSITDLGNELLKILLLDKKTDNNRDLITSKMHNEKSITISKCLAIKLEELVNLSRERKDTKTTHSLKNILSILTSLGREIYYEMFHNNFKDKLESYLISKKEEILNTNDTLKCIQLINETIEVETSYVINTFKEANNETYSMEINAINAILVEQTMEHVIENKHNGIETMLNNKEHKAINAIYKTVINRKTEKTINLIKPILKAHITSQKINHSQSQPERAIRVVNSLLSAKQNYENINKTAFDDNETLLMSMNDSFKILVNSVHDIPLELATYTDYFLREARNSKKQKEEIVRTIDKITTIVRHIKNRDIFEMYYKDALAKRLLESINSTKPILYDYVEMKNYEKEVLNRLKIEFGKRFVANMETMFDDLDNSQLILKETARIKTKFEAEFYILTNSVWPIPAKNNSKTQTISIPILENACEKFTDYYKNKYNGRRLHWIMSMGLADLTYTLDNKTYQINVSTCQMVILMIFNDVQKLTFGELKQAMGSEFEDELVRRNLHCLSRIENPILTIEGDLNEENAQIFLNRSFDNDMNKIDIIKPTQLNTSNENKQKTNELEMVAETRHHVLEATIVRIMKKYTRLNLSSLTKKVDQIESGFRVEPQEITTRIISLLKREYIKVSEGTEGCEIYEYIP